MQQHLQLVFFKAEDDAVHRYEDLLVFNIKLGHGCFSEDYHNAI